MPSRKMSVIGVTGGEAAMHGAGVEGGGEAAVKGGDGGASRGVPRRDSSTGFASRRKGATSHDDGCDASVFLAQVEGRCSVNLM